MAPQFYDKGTSQFLQQLVITFSQQINHTVHVTYILKYHVCMTNYFSFEKKER